jgi:hypothetical protein
MASLEDRAAIKALTSTNTDLRRAGSLIGSRDVDVRVRWMASEGNPA